MGTTKGYYSIVQYCPDASRLEAVNVGVALFCPDVPWLKVRFGRRRSQIRQLFGERDWAFVEAQQQAIEARLTKAGEEFRRLEEFEDYISRRANAMRLTAARPMKVEDPEEELGSLLKRLVGVARAESPRQASMTRELKEALRVPGVAEKLQRNVQVQPPNVPRPIRAPLAFQNGRLNLIEPVEFEGQSAQSVFNRASARAVEGSLVNGYHDPKYGELAMVVVAKFGLEQKAERETAETIFDRHQVKMYRMGELEPLIEQIRRIGH